MTYRHQDLWTLCFLFVMAFQATHAQAPVSLEVHQTPIGQSVTVLTIDPKQTRVIAIHANQQILGRAPLSQMAKQYGALAGINGGFFRLSQTNNGFPAGILKIQSQWYGIAYRNRGALAWNASDGIPLFDRIRTKTRLQLDHQILTVQGLNLAFGSKPHLLYSDAFGSQEIPIPPKSTAFLFTGQKIQGVFKPSLEEKKGMDLPAGPFTLKVPANHFLYLTDQFIADPDHFLGKSAHLQIDILPEFDPQAAETWSKKTFIVGGSPLLIKNKQLIRDFQTEKLTSDFVYGPHARSAIGVLANGDWVFVVADQNLLNKDPGMTIPELGRFMKQLGCVCALNLDGGISSTLYFNGSLVNSPLIERAIGDAILVLPLANNSENQ